MEITVLRGSVSVSSLSGGSLAWSRKSVTNNLCRTLSFDIHKSEVQRHSSLYRKPPYSGSGTQFSRSQGVANDMALLTRSIGLDSFRCHYFSQSFGKSQKFSCCLHLGDKVTYSRSSVCSRRTVGAQFQLFCTGPVLFKLATRFHTASVQEGRYICTANVEQRVAECQSADSSNDSSVNTSYKEDESEYELSSGVTCRTWSDNVDAESDAGDSTIKHWVVNFYHFVSIDEPHLEVARHAEFLKNHDVRGRIYISEQGMNAQLSSRGKAAVDYAEWLKMDPRFSDLLVQTSPSPEGHAFPRLRLRYKPSLVQVEGGTKHLPVTDPTARAVPLSPAEWNNRLHEAKLVGPNKNVASQQDSKLDHGRCIEDNPSSSSVRQVVLLDVRNGYEWDVGHFKGAQRPDVDCFKRTTFGLADEEDAGNDPLADVDKEKVDVMMYCTGGIRCDVYSTILRAKGFKNLYSLKGGVSNYLKEEGAKEWAGNLFVFDSRLAVPPEVYHSKSTEEGGISEATLPTKSGTEEVFARCRLCGDPLSTPRHRNCANLDCNQLYLSCDECLPGYKGCCSRECSSAPKLRPLILSQQYERWHKYRPMEPAPTKPTDYVSRRAMKRRRRKERRKQLMMGGGSEDGNYEQLVQSA